MFAPPATRPSGLPPPRPASGRDSHARRARRNVARAVLLFGAIAATTAAVSGCMIGPDFKRPSAKLAARWTDTTDPGATPASDAEAATEQQQRDWWKVFDDATLTQLVETAYQQSLTLQAAGVRVLQARAQLGLALGEFFPQQQTVSAKYSYDRIPLTVPYNLIDNTYQQALFGAQAAWELDLWGKIRRGIQSADAAFLASVASYDDVLVTLLGDVASTYVKIRTIESQLRIAHENVVKQETALTIARNRFRGGVVSKRDVYQAENVLGQTQSSIPQLEIDLAQAKNALCVLLGLPPGGADEMLAGPSTIPVAPPEVAAGIPADLLRRRPDVRKAELDAMAQNAQIGFAKADLLPALSLIGNVGTVASDIGKANLTDLFTGRSVSSSIGPAVQWNVLNYGQITNNVRVQDAKLQALLIDYQNAVLTAQKDVQNGLVAFVKSRAQSIYLEQSTKAAEGALTIALNQYKEGTADFTTVLTAEQNLYAAQSDLQTARGDIALGLITAYRALGGGWQIREGNDFVPEATRTEMAERTDWGTWLSPQLLQPDAPGLPSADDASGAPGLPEW
jgi:NodT family efflux transporter outer membrane factor (OMF) lipoprotein